MRKIRWLKATKLSSFAPRRLLGCVSRGPLFRPRNVPKIHEKRAKRYLFLDLREGILRRVRVLLRHHTTYRYADPALLGPHVVRLRPAVHGRARVLNYDLSVEPKAELRWQHDPWGNRIARLTFGAGAPIEALALKVELGLEIRPVVADLGFRSPPSSVAIGGGLLTPLSADVVEVEVPGIGVLSNPIVRAE